MKRPDDKEGQRWLAQAFRDFDDAACGGCGAIVIPAPCIRRDKLRAGISPFRKDMQQRDSGTSPE